MDHGEGGPVNRVGRHNPSAGVGDDGAIIGGAGDEVNADQLGDVSGAGPSGDLDEGAGLYDASGFEDDDPIGQGVGVHGIVGDEQVNPVIGGQMAAQVAANLSTGAGVEGGEGLVEEQQPGFGGEGPGQCDPLGLTAGEGPGSVLSPVGQADPVEPRRGPGPSLGFTHAPGPQPESHVFESGQVGEQEIVLKDHADGTPIGGNEDVLRRIVQDSTIESKTAVVKG